MHLVRAAAFGSLLALSASFVTAAEMTVSESAIQWSAYGAYERVVITIGAPDGSTFRKEFGAGRPPVLRLADLTARIDGSYTWELRTMPSISDDVRAQ